MVASADHPEAWKDDAACRGMDPGLFFPEGHGVNLLVQAARDVCDLCPVADECRDYAQTNGEKFGVWGGVAVGYQRRSRYRRNAAARARRRALRTIQLEDAER